MKKALSLLAISGLLASCASSTMDSVPTVAQLDAYVRSVRARYQAQYNELEARRAKGTLSKEEYAQQKAYLDSVVNEEANNAAWNKHFLAESERKADGVPTPDQPVALTSGLVGRDSFYRPSSQNFGQAIGQGGSAGLGSMRAAQEQFQAAQSIRNDAVSSGGTYLSRPTAGSVYDDERR